MGDGKCMRRLRVELSVVSTAPRGSECLQRRSQESLGRTSQRNHGRAMSEPAPIESKALEVQQVLVAARIGRGSQERVWD